MNQNKRIKYKHIHQNKTYFVIVEIPKDTKITIYFADLIFNEQLKKPQNLNLFYGTKTQKDKDFLKNVKIISIAEIEKESIFK
jgi:hypothetical protein